MNNNLTLTKMNGSLMVDSLEVAVMIDRPHNDLMKTIRLYAEYLGQGDFSLSDFFIESTYFNSQNKKQPHFFLTRKGCDMVANKMTGEKGVLFTAAYVTKFDEMEKQISSPKVLSEKEQLIASMRLSIESNERIGEVEKEVGELKERFENDLTLRHGESSVLNHAIKKRVETLFKDGITGSLETKSQMYSNIYSQLYRAFQAPTYREVKRKDFDESILWVNAWRPL